MPSVDCSFSSLPNAKRLATQMEGAGYHAINRVAVGSDGRPVSKVIIVVHGSEDKVNEVKESLEAVFHIKGMVIHD